jgi:heterodisulfide reductase subunit D
MVSNPLDTYVEEITRCNRCGFCLATCPVYSVAHDEAVAPRGLLRLVRARYEDELPANDTYAERVFSCSLCGVCTPTCPSGVKVDRILHAAREDLADQDMLPPTLEQMSRSLCTSHHLGSKVAEGSMAWAEDLPHVSDRQGSEEELAYFVGCVSSAHPAAQSVFRSLVRVLERMRRDYTLLAGEEWCCGYPLFANGERDRARELMDHNVATMHSLGVKRVLCTCASCYHMWANVYPDEMGDLGLEVVHAAQFLADLLTDQQPAMRPLSARATYHDPCYLGRGSGIFDAPRQVLASIPQIELVEMVTNRANALCCGDGGNLEIFDPNLSQEVTRLRLAEAQDTNAQILVTACARNKRTLADAAARHNVSLEVLDVVELVERATRELGT